MPETQRPSLEISVKIGYDWHIYKGAFQATGTCLDVLSNVLLAAPTYKQTPAQRERRLMAPCSTFVPYVLSSPCSTQTHYWSRITAPDLTSA